MKKTYGSNAPNGVEPGFHGDTALNEDGSMSGTYVLMPGVMCAYSAYDQTRTNPNGSPPRYLVRGSVRLLDAAGDIFKSQASPALISTYGTTEQADAEAPPQAKTVAFHRQTKAINVASKDGDIICKMIEQKARKLVQENARYLFSDVEKAKPISQLCLALLFQLHRKRYLSMLLERGIAASDGARAERERLINKIASSKLGLRPLGDITAKELKELSKELGDHWRDYYKETADYIDFLYMRKHDSNTANAFRDYLTAHPPKKLINAQKLQTDAVNSCILTPQMDRQFYEDVANNIGDGGMIGAAIVRAAGFNAKQTCDLKWDQIKFLDDTHTRALVRFFQDEKAGRVRNYSFLLSPLYAHILALREQWLVEHGYTPGKDVEFVASAPNAPAKKLESKELVRICRALAHRYQVSYATLAGLRNMENGAGIKVFQETRRHYLEETGMKFDVGLLRFYLHDSLANNTQANNYRSLSGESAQHVAMIYLRRADIHLTDAVANTNRVTRAAADAGEVITAHAPDSHSAVSGTVTARLKKGDIIRISGPNGVRIKVKAVEQAQSENVP